MFRQGKKFKEFSFSQKTIWPRILWEKNFPARTRLTTLSDHCNVFVKVRNCNWTFLKSFVMEMNFCFCLTNVQTCAWKRNEN